MNDERMVLGSVYRVTADFLAQRSLGAALLPGLSPEARAVIEKPPFAFAWKSSSALEEIERALSAMPDGRELCEELGLAASLHLCGSVISSPEVCDQAPLRATVKYAVQWD